MKLYIRPIFFKSNTLSQQYTGYKDSLHTGLYTNFTSIFSNSRNRIFSVWITLGKESEAHFRQKVDPR